MFTRSPLQSLRSWCTNKIQPLILSRPHSTSKRPYTEAEDELIVARRRENKTYKIIASELNRTLASVKSHMYNTTRCKRSGTQPNRSESLYTHEDVNKAREMLATGQSRRDVARQMGISYNRLKMTLDNPRSQRQAKHGLSKADTAEIITLRTEQKLPLSELARQTGWSYDTVRRILYETGRLGGFSVSSAALPYTAAEDTELLMYQCQGLSHRAIARMMPGRTFSDKVACGRSVLGNDYYINTHVSNFNDCFAQCSTDSTCIGVVLTSVDAIRGPSVNIYDPNQRAYKDILVIGSKGSVDSWVSQIKEPLPNSYSCSKVDTQIALDPSSVSNLACSI
ncbi:hypothetical protein LTR17_016973 [Elasticomyces elasticus]|nr:hypothetical protein LTR17_016973 [Elasticomyces elasticus]